MDQLPPLSDASPIPSSSPVKSASAAAGFLALAWVVAVLGGLLLAVLNGLQARSVPWYQVLGAFVGVWLLWGLWATGFCLSRRRRPSVLAALAVISAAFQRLRYGR